MPQQTLHATAYLVDGADGSPTLYVRKQVTSGKETPTRSPDPYRGWGNGVRILEVLDGPDLKTAVDNVVSATAVGLRDEAKAMGVKLNFTLDDMRRE